MLSSEKTVMNSLANSLVPIVSCIVTQPISIYCYRLSAALLRPSQALWPLFDSFLGFEAISYSFSLCGLPGGNFRTSTEQLHVTLMIARIAFHFRKAYYHFHEVVAVPGSQYHSELFWVFC